MLTRETSVSSRESVEKTASANSPTFWNYVLNAGEYVSKRENRRDTRGVIMTFTLSGLCLL